MSAATPRVLMRLLAGAFLLLLGNATDGRARTSEHSHRGSSPAIAAASQSALLAATPVAKDVDAALPPLLASATSTPDGRVQSAAPAARDASSLCSCERATVQAARPPPLQA